MVSRRVKAGSMVQVVNACVGVRMREGGTHYASACVGRRQTGEEWVSYTFFFSFFKFCQCFLKEKK